MSDQQQESSFEEVLVNRLAQRLGIAATQIEALQLQLEIAQAENEQLRAQIPTDANPPMNGDGKTTADEWQPVAPI
jgi:hypothetical protein